MGFLTKAFMPVGLGGLGVGKNPFSGGGDSSSGIPGAPAFQPVAEVGKGYRFLQGEGMGLVNGLTGKGPEPGGLLADTISFNPKVTQLALEAMQAQLAPSYRNSQQNLANTLEANNQLTGSTTASSFGNLEADYLAQLTNVQAQAGLADINRALQNRVSLYGTGLDTVNASTSLALQDQAQINNFALSNYDNQVAYALSQEKPQTGGLLGGITGAIGGGLGGFAATGSPYGAAIGAGLGGFSGYSGAPGTGGQFIGVGAGLYGATRPLSLNVTNLGANQGGEYINNTLNSYNALGNRGLLSYQYPY